MNIHKKRSSLKGAGMVDYVVPLLLVAVVAGVAIYALVGNESIKNNFIHTVGGKIEVITDKVVFGEGDYAPGLYANSDGSYILSTKSGKLIDIPEIYYDTVKNSILQSNKDASNMGVETSGAFGTDGGL